MFVILGFYKFKKFKLLKKNKLILHKYFKDMNIRGSLIISKEGLNGSISGKPKSIFIFNKIIPFFWFDMIIFFNFGKNI